MGAALGTSGELFAAGIAADVIVTAVWMAICLAVPVILSRANGTRGATRPRASRVGEAEGKLYASVGAVAILDVALLAVIVLGTLWASAVLGDVLAPVPAVLWLTTIALVLAQIPRVGRIRGAGVIGNWLVLLFLASNGAKSVVANILAVGPAVMWFALVTVGVHGLIIFGLGMLVRLDPRTLAVASQANVGGSASAMALASARGCTELTSFPASRSGSWATRSATTSASRVAVVVRGWLGA